MFDVSQRRFRFVLVAAAVAATAAAAAFSQTSNGAALFCVVAYVKHILTYNLHYNKYLFIFS